MPMTSSSDRGFCKSPFDRQHLASTLPPSLRSGTLSDTAKAFDTWFLSGSVVRAGDWLPLGRHATHTSVFGPHRPSDNFDDGTQPQCETISTCTFSYCSGWPASVQPSCRSPIASCSADSAATTPLAQALLSPGNCVRSKLSSWIEAACRRSCTPRRRMPATAHKHCRQSPMCPAFLASAADRAVIRMSLSWIADTTARRLGAPCVHGASSRSSLVAERITEAASDGVNRFSIGRSIDSKDPSHSRPTRRSHSNQLVRMSSFQPSPVSVSDCGEVSRSNEPLVSLKLARFYHFCQGSQRPLGGVFNSTANGGHRLNTTLALWKTRSPMD